MAPNKSVYINGYTDHTKEKKRKDKCRLSIEEQIEETPWPIVISTYISLGVMFLFGYISELLISLGIKKSRAAKETNRPGYAPLYSNFESFYIRNIYRRLCEVVNNPICSAPGAAFRILERTFDEGKWTYEVEETSFPAINLGSYNYLGFAEATGLRVEQVKRTICEEGIGVCSTRHEVGTLHLHQKLETLVARFLGTEDCIVFGMGFATNSTNIPTLINKGCLIISDELNHASLILGCRLSGASIKVFKHNNIPHLEQILRQSIVEGRPRTGRPWKKIIILVEGVYSMEGTVVNLPALIRLKNKYKAYLYLDEAHSIGAMGPRGRGILDYYNCDPRDVDVLMGTFTKSFGSAGGYIAGSKKLIDHIRCNSHSFSYATSIAPPVMRQIMTTALTIMGEDATDEGSQRIKNLATNIQYFRTRLKEMGFIVYGNMDSPVVPILLAVPSKITAFFNNMMKRGIATVVIGFPATPLLGFRARLCLSASHTREMLDRTLEAVDEVGDLLKIKYSKNSLRIEKH